jgi:hypothetical protein
MLGVDVLDRRLVIVQLDQAGRGLGRGEAALGGGVESALTAALEGATGNPGAHAESGTISAIGVAAHDTDSDECRAVVEALARRYPGHLTREQPLGATPRGAAAAIGESWIGAARDAGEVVFFAVAEHATAGIVRNGRPFVGAHGRATASAFRSCATQPGTSGWRRRIS